MNLYDYDGRPLVGDLSDPLLERLRAVHGEPRREHQDGGRETADECRRTGTKLSKLTD